MKRFYLLWYLDKQQNNYIEKDFSTKQALLNFYEKHKNDKDKFYFWGTKRNSNGEVVEDIIY